MKKAAFITEKRRNTVITCRKNVDFEEDLIKINELNSDINILLRTINLNFNFGNFDINQSKLLEKVRKIIIIKIIVFKRLKTHFISKRIFNFEIIRI